MEITWWKSIILGIIQGLAEFLPISSSGHLELFEHILGVEEVPRLFDVCLHIGTLLAVFIIFWKDIWSVIRHPKQKLTAMILLATAPTVVIAVLLEVILPESFSSMFLGYGFMITGILLYSMEMISTNYANKTLETIKPKDALLVGCVQGIATISGISRSGSTISSGVFFGMDRKFLARFSFLMSIPAILGAFCWDVLKLILKGNDSVVKISWFSTILGMVAAFVVGFLAIKYMLHLIKNKSFKPFAIYTLLLGFFVCLDKFLLHIIF